MENECYSSDKSTENMGVTRKSEGCQRLVERRLTISSALERRFDLKGNLWMVNSLIKNQEKESEANLTTWVLSYAFCKLSPLVCNSQRGCQNANQRSQCKVCQGLSDLFPLFLFYFTGSRDFTGFMSSFRHKSIFILVGHSAWIYTLRQVL